MPRSISKLSGGPTGPEAPKVELLVMTGKRGITKSDIRNNVAYTNPSVDREGNIGLIAAAEKGSIQGVAADRGTTRLVVSGDSYFLGNGTIENAANRDFANLAVNWLLDRNYLLGGIGPRPITDYKINLTNNQLTRVRWLMLAALPGAVILCGLIVWMRRRS